MRGMRSGEGEGQSSGVTVDSSGVTVNSQVEPVRWWYADALVGYAVGGVGFWFQLCHGFNAIPFPIAIFLWPLDLVEWYIRWSVSAAEA